MGHERIGFLPQTKKWRMIVDSLSRFGDGEISVTQIANDTLNAIKTTYNKMPYDESLIKALSFIATLSFSAKQANQVDFLNSNGYSVDANISLFSLMASAQNYISTEHGSLEINKLAKDSTMQAIIDYQQKHDSNQLALFSEKSENVWGDTGNGAAFCEMARTFFSSFTERQLKYYIERAAASSIDNYETLKSFNQQLSEQSKAIADHSFEISKLTQSFAAGWFNKNATDSLPSEKQIEGFLRMSFGKLREEFRREVDGQ
ncbi:hypothetical protein LJC56_01065 [Christensenellaceae bacterium OttesenSCG-928-K19]|nr:hypothetical protein [Christensenellaceae bacterium OttesenSCG-928-K19]